MRMRIQFLLVTLVAVVFAAVFLHVKVVKAQAVQPMTVRVQETHYDAKGIVTDFRITTEGFRSDGSVARIIQMRSNKPEPTPSGYFENREILDRTKGLQMTASPDLKMKSTVSGPTGVPGRSRWSADCVRSGFHTDHQFDRTILGERAVYLISEQPVEGGRRMISKEWRAPDLNCLMLEREYVIGEGTNASRTVTVALELRKGEPDESMFTLPPNLTESSPSEMLRAVKQFEGEQPNPKCEETATRADQKYHSKRKGAHLER